MDKKEIGVESKAPSTQPHSSEVVTGEAFLAAIKSGEISINHDISFAGGQSLVLSVVWKEQNYLIFLPKLYACEATVLDNLRVIREILMSKRIEGLTDYIELKDETISEKILEQLQHQSREGTTFGATLTLWKDQIARLVQIEGAEYKPKLIHSKLIGICKQAPGKELEKWIQDQKETEVSELKVNDAWDWGKRIGKIIIEYTVLVGAHGDLSPKNIIVDVKENDKAPSDRKKEITIIDYGCSIKNTQSGMVKMASFGCMAAPCYAVPELIIDNQAKVLVAKIDTWALGVLLVCLLTGKHDVNLLTLKPFSKDLIPTQLQSIYTKFLSVDKPVINQEFLESLKKFSQGKKVINFLNKTLQVNPKHRADVFDLINLMDYTVEEVKQIVQKNMPIALENKNFIIVKKLWERYKEKVKSEFEFIDQIVFASLESVDPIIPHNIEILSFLIWDMVPKSKFYENFSEVKKCVELVVPKTENYSNFLSNLIDHFGYFIKLQMGKGKSPLLLGELSKLNLEQRNQLLFFALSQFYKLKKENDKEIIILPSIKCHECLQQTSLLPKIFKELDFIKPLILAFESLEKSRKKNQLILEEKQAKLVRESEMLKAKELIEFVNKEEIEKIISCLSQGVSIFSCVDERNVEYTVLDLIFKRILLKENNLLESKLQLQLNPEEYWKKYSRVQCQILYALVKQEGIGHRDLNLRTSKARLHTNLSLLGVTCNLRGIAFCDDKDKGFYVAAVQKQHDKIEELTQYGMGRWNKIGNEFCQFLNTIFPEFWLSPQRTGHPRMFEKTTDPKLATVPTEIYDVIYMALIAKKDFIDAFIDQASQLRFPNYNLQGLIEALIEKFTPTLLPETSSYSFSMGKSDSS